MRALAEGGEDAKVIAGGQSLLPLLRLRLAFPELLVDIGDLRELRGIRDEGDSLWIGALTTHAEVVRDPLVREHCGLLSEAAGTVADPAVRHRGTLGGSLSHADPAGDLPAVALALQATMTAAGPGGSRDIAAADFFADYLTTTLGQDEILTGVRVPNSARLGAIVMRSSTGRPRRGRSWVWRPWPGDPTGRSPKPGSGSPTWVPSRSGPGRRRRRSPGPRLTAAPCGRPQRTPTRKRSRRQTCTARPTTGATWRGC